MGVELIGESKELLENISSKASSNESKLTTIINTLQDSINVFIQDQTTEIIDLHFSKLVQAYTIVTDTNVDDTSVTINAGAEPTDGNTVCFKENSAFYQGTILSHSASGDNWIINLDVPLDYAFTTSVDCAKEASINLAVDGSVTPQIFTISPKELPNVKWDITRILGSIIDATAMDDGKFGGMTALTKGIYIRKKDGTHKNIFNAKTNGDLAAHMYDVTYISDTFGPAGKFGLRFRRTFNGQDKNGVVIRLNSETDDELQCVIQDDLTDLDEFSLIAQGHIVED
jgi:hypothetical protein